MANLADGSDAPPGDATESEAKPDTNKEANAEEEEVKDPKAEEEARIAAKKSKNARKKANKLAREKEYEAEKQAMQNSLPQYGKIEKEALERKCLENVGMLCLLVDIKWVFFGLYKLFWDDRKDSSFRTQWESSNKFETKWQTDIIPQLFFLGQKIPQDYVAGQFTNLKMG